MLVDGVVVFASGVELHVICKQEMTKCGNKGKYGRQAALHSLMVGRCVRGQGLGGSYQGGEVNMEHESIYM